MLSLVMLGDMNRSEQENLYRTSRKLSLVPITGSHAHAGVFDSDRRRTSTARMYEESSAKLQQHEAGAVYPEDLVLSVLKSPLNHVGIDQKDPAAYGASPSSEVALCGDTPDDDARYKPAGSEDDLTDCEPTERLPFLQRLRGHRAPRFGEAHHKRVPTPLKRKQRFSRNHKLRDVIAAEDVVDEEDGEEVAADTPRGVPDPYYPIYLPIDQAFRRTVKKWRPIRHVAYPIRTIRSICLSIRPSRRIPGADVRLPRTSRRMVVLLLSLHCGMPRILLPYRSDS
ncbi:hypothetical protein QE152_g34485 [Popillia japonica]|uniref:Uncharacterized protein n=1 Tax=Popillia japonica TaxID=7064 RepID=A0AAW1ITS5_POPJA